MYITGRIKGTVVIIIVFIYLFIIKNSLSLLVVRTLLLYPLKTVSRRMLHSLVMWYWLEIKGNISLVL